MFQIVPIGHTFQVLDGCATPGLGGYYADDLSAIRAGAVRDGFIYKGAAATDGHAAIRNPAQALLIRLRTDDGTTGWGDAVTVQYAGFAGREPPIDPSVLMPELDRAFASLSGAGAVTFLDACRVVEDVRIEGRPLHSGVRYGLSQALLSLAAETSGSSPAQILMQTLGDRTLQPVPVYAQSGEERELNVDKMILKDVDVLPHGLINSPGVFGAGGAGFVAYAGWVRDRIIELGREGYHPVLHFDVYGLLGAETDGDRDAMARICKRLVDACDPFAVQIESPAYGADGESTAELLSLFRSTLARNSIPVRVVADDWCNTIADIRRFLDAGATDMVQIKMPDLGSLSNAVEAVQVCRDAGAAVFVGGSCTETDLSARASAQLAVAAGADQVLAKPGMGVDEALAITRNEMLRACMP